MDLTFRNDMLDTRATVRVNDLAAKVSWRALARVRAKLLPVHLAPPGSAARREAGPLGEHGPQEPIPGWRYEIRPTPDGGAELIPREITNGRARRGRKAKR